MSVLLTLSIVQPMTEYLNAYPRVLILIKWDASCHSRPSSVTPSRFESSFYLVCSVLHFFLSFFSKHLEHVCCQQLLKIITKAKSVKLEQGPEHPEHSQNTSELPRNLIKYPENPLIDMGKQPRTHVRMQYKANKNLKQRRD